MPLLPGKVLQRQGLPSSGPAGPPSPEGEGLGVLPHSQNFGDLCKYRGAGGFGL